MRWTRRSSWVCYWESRDNDCELVNGWFVGGALSWAEEATLGQYRYIYIYIFKRDPSAAATARISMWALICADAIQLDTRTSLTYTPFRFNFYAVLIESQSNHHAAERDLFRATAINLYALYTNLFTPQQTTANHCVSLRGLRRISNSIQFIIRKLIIV